MKTLILIMGHPGVGKTYISKKLEKAIPNAYLLCSDKFWQKHGRQYDPDEVSEEDKKEFRENYLKLKIKEAEKKIKEYDTIIIDGLFKRESDRKFFYDFAEKHNLKLKIIRVVCPDAIVIKRINEHYDHVSIMEYRLKSFKYAKKEWKPIEKPHITINNEKEINVEEILKKLKL